MNSIFNNIIKLSFIKYSELFDLKHESHPPKLAVYNNDLFLFYFSYTLNSMCSFYNFCF